MPLPKINNNYNQALNLLNYQNQGLNHMLGSVTNGFNLLSQNRAKQEDELYRQKLLESMQNPYIANKGTEFEHIDPYRTQDGKSVYSLLDQHIAGMTPNRRQSIFSNLLNQHLNEAKSRQMDIQSNILLNKQNQNKQLLTMLNQTKDVNKDGVVDYNDFTPQEKQALGSSEANMYSSILSKYQNQALNDNNQWNRRQLLRKQSIKDKKDLFNFEANARNKINNENFKNRELLKIGAKNMQLENQLSNDSNRLLKLKEMYNNAKTYEEQKSISSEILRLKAKTEQEKGLLDYNNNYQSLLLGKPVSKNTPIIDKQIERTNVPQPTSKQIVAPANKPTEQSNSFGFGGQTLESLLLGNKKQEDIPKNNNEQSGYPFTGVKGTLLPRQKEQATIWTKNKIDEIVGSDIPLEQKIEKINQLKKTVGKNVNVDEFVNNTDLGTELKNQKEIVSTINSTSDIHGISEDTINNLDKYGITFNFSGTIFKSDRNAIKKVKNDISKYPYGMNLFSKILKQFDRGVIGNSTALPSLQKAIGTYDTQDAIYDSKNNFWSDEIGGNVAKFKSFKDGIPKDINEKTINTKYKDVGFAVKAMNNLEPKLGSEYIKAIQNRNKEEMKKIENIATKKSLDYYNNLMKHALLDVYKNNGTDIPKKQAVDAAYQYIIDNPTAYGFDNQEEAGQFFGFTGSLIGNYIGNK